MMKLLKHGMVAGMVLALIAAPVGAASAGAGAGPGGTVESAGPAVQVTRSSAIEAAARKKSAKTTTSFGMTTWGGEAALGTVSSKNAKCVKNRKVKLYLIRPGKSRKLVGMDRKTGSPFGNGAGYWVIPVNLKVGKKYQAVVTKRVVGKITCKSYKTSKLKFYG